ncbi:MAG: serine/threonine protein kinase [Gammaproteobacteria bacterium]|nr:serine/threonine protein kinase [Gammaproteobacteria bacterium]
MSSAVPRSVGKYEIVDAIGSGGMGTVYRAFDPTLERMVALKIVHLDRVQEVPAEQLRERFRNEARAVARLNHPAIVTIFDYDDQDPVGAYIAMEYVQGCALDEYVKQRPELHLEDAVSAMHQVLGGLAYAHGKDVVHRDVKPSNLLVTRDGLVKITDFGIARIGPRSTTQTGLLVGTPQYMAPEQYMGGMVDHRCDIHAAGAVLYELLTGSPPFTGTSAEIMYKVCHQVPKPMSSVDASIPTSFDAVVAKSLEKRPADRYVSALEFQQALRASWQAISPKPPSATLSQNARLIATAIHRQPVAAVRPVPLPPALAAGALESVPGAGPLGAARAAEKDRYAIKAPAASLPASSSRPPSSSQPPGSASGQPPGPASSQPGSLVAWSREQLAEIERDLLPLVGPMARILVRDAAANTASRQELYRMLATHLHTAEERRKFMLAAERSATTGGGGMPAQMAMPAQTPPRALSRPVGTGSARPLTPEATQRACQLLARYIGPIASVVTRRAAQNVTDEAQFYALIAEKIAEGPERDRFMREVLRGR